MNGCNRPELARLCFRLGKAGLDQPEQLADHPFDHFVIVLPPGVAETPVPFGRHFGTRLEVIQPQHDNDLTSRVDSIGPSLTWRQPGHIGLVLLSSQAQTGVPKTGPASKGPSGALG
jgi:hypothetical protein